MTKEINESFRSFQEVSEMKVKRGPAQKRDFNAMMSGAMSRKEYEAKHGVKDGRSAAHKRMEGPGRIYRNLIKHPDGSVKEDLDENAVYSHEAVTQAKHHEDRHDHHMDRASETDGDLSNHHRHIASLHHEASKHFRSARKMYLHKDSATAGRFMENGRQWAQAAEKHNLHEELNEMSKDKLVAYQSKVAPGLSKLSGRKLDKREKGLEMARNKYWNSPRVRVGSKEKNHTDE
jgi:hypothetical protein